MVDGDADRKRGKNRDCINKLMVKRQDNMEILAKYGLGNWKKKLYNFVKKMMDDGDGFFYDCDI